VAQKQLAVVTGGMGGLGESISTKMADAGYKVVVTYSPSNTKYKSWLDEMKGKGYSFSAYPVDGSPSRIARGGADPEGLRQHRHPGEQRRASRAT
jgi:NAD(P)-dependent dehydrogenase (short-subunit alcohol dehydrogenase family)